MAFSESSNMVDLKVDDNLYHLNIKAVYSDKNGNQPDHINLNIVLVDFIFMNKYRIQALKLIYTLRTRSYHLIECTNDLSSKLYESIIRMLDETYGHTWGYEIQ